MILNSIPPDSVYSTRHGLLARYRAARYPTGPGTVLKRIPPVSADPTRRGLSSLGTVSQGTPHGNSSFRMPQYPMRYGGLAHSFP